jgi:acetolactate synthase-1/2/3 large subunit
VHPEAIRLSVAGPVSLLGEAERSAPRFWRRRKLAMTGADLLVQMLKAQDVPFVSTLCGNGLDPLYVACKRHGLRLIDVRNEQAAGYMADAVGKLTRRVGVCTSSSGVAHLNA